jgi:integrase
VQWRHPETPQECITEPPTLALATHLLELGGELRTIRELLGHSAVRITVIHTHVLNRGPLAVASPVDRL